MSISAQVNLKYAIRAYNIARKHLRDTPQDADRIIAGYKRFYGKHITYVMYLEDIAADIAQLATTHTQAEQLAA